MSDQSMPVAASSATDTEINAMLDQLNAADFSMARIQEDLKDADRRQEIGKRLVAMLAEASDEGLVYQKIKISAKAGILKVGFEFPILVFRDLLGKAIAGPTP
jgi:hypothetical protein